MGAIHWECGNNRVYVATELANDDTIADLVTKEVRKGSGNREIHLKADRKVNYSVVRNVMERIHNAGVSTVGLGSEELKKD
jgi:biopolymer transport protein ExbD